MNTTQQPQQSTMNNPIDDLAPTTTDGGGELHSITPELQNQTTESESVKTESDPVSSEATPDGEEKKEKTSVDPWDEQETDEDALKSKEETAEATYTYEYDLPDFIDPESFDKEGFEGFKAFAKENNINDKAFKHLLDTYLGNMNNLVQQQQQAVEVRKTDYLKSLKSDPDLGGAKFRQNADYASKAIDAYGGAPLANALREEGGAVNRKEIFAAFVKIGKQLSEASPVQANSPTPTQNLDVVKLFYAED